jgi:hypothetical protein
VARTESYWSPERPPATSALTQQQISDVRNVLADEVTSELKLD